MFSHREGGDCFFVLCHINCMEILTTIIYLFHIKTWNFLYKNPRVFYSIFSSQQTAQTSLFLIAQHHQKQFLLFHFSPKPTAEGETKRQQSKQLQFHKINPKKKKTYVTHLLSDANRTFLLTSLNLFPGANCQICLLFTERYQSQNPKAFKMHPQPYKLFQTYQNQLIFRLQVVTTLFKISFNHSTSA